MGSHGSVMADSARDKRNAAEAARDEWDAAKAAAEETLIQRNRLDESLAECKKQLKKCERKLKKRERKLAEQRDATSEAYKKFLGARFQSESWDDVSGSPSLSDRDSEWGIPLTPPYGNCDNLSLSDANATTTSHRSKRQKP